MNWYNKFVDFAYKDKCYWYRDALKESKLFPEHYENWADCLECEGESFMPCFERNPNSDLEITISQSLSKVKREDL